MPLSPPILTVIADLADPGTNAHLQAHESTPSDNLVYRFYKRLSPLDAWVSIVGPTDDSSATYAHGQGAGITIYFKVQVSDGVDTLDSATVPFVVPDASLHTDGFRFVFEVGEVPTIADSVEIMDPTGTVGIYGHSTGTAYLAPGAVMSSTIPGVYTYSIVGLDPASVAGVLMDWFAKVTYQGQVYHFFRQTKDGITFPVSAFCSWEEFVRRWGFGNIAVASNKDNASKIPDYEAIQDAFDFATDEVNSSQKGGRYAVPLDFATNGGVIPRKVREWAMVIAFENLYNGRGLDDKNKVGNKITKQLSDVHLDMSFHHNGVRQIPAVLATATDGSTVTGEIASFRGCPGLRRWYWIGDAPVFSGVLYYA